MATADELTSELKIEITGIDLADEDVLRSVFARIVRDRTDIKAVDLVCSERRESGHLEYGMYMHYRGEEDRGITIGVVQRAPGEITEFHS